MNARKLLFSLALLAAPGAARAGGPDASDWAPSPKSQARLIADGAGQAAFQVKLAPGAITYWRDPGESGVPPTFDFSASVNLARAEVRLSRAEAHRGARRQRSLWLQRGRGVSDSRRGEGSRAAGHARAQRQLCRLRENLPARARFAQPDACLRRRDAVRRRYRGRARESAATCRRGGARGRGDGGRRAQLDALRPRERGRPRAISLSSRRRAGGSRQKPQTAAEGRDCFALALRQAPADAAFPVAVSRDHHGRRGRGGDGVEAGAEILKARGLRRSGQTVE